MWRAALSVVFCVSFGAFLGWSIVAVPRRRRGRLYVREPRRLVRDARMLLGAHAYAAHSQCQGTRIDRLACGALSFRKHPSCASQSSADRRRARVPVCGCSMQRARVRRKDNAPIYVAAGSQDGREREAPVCARHARPRARVGRTTKETAPCRRIGAPPRTYRSCPSRSTGGRLKSLASRNVP